MLRFYHQDESTLLADGNLENGGLIQDGQGPRRDEFESFLEAPSTEERVLVQVFLAVLLAHEVVDRTLVLLASL